MTVCSPNCFIRWWPAGSPNDLANRPKPQSRGWPEIAAGRNTLIAAPTGSGKTLSAFLVCLDRLAQRHTDGTLEDHTYVVYVSPLKALSNDIHRNLEVPLAELSQRFDAAGHGPLPIRACVRTGDTPARERQAMLRKPPHILVTTPESLYLLLTSAKRREHLSAVETVIVDEIHALVRDKRGSHLALTLERLDQLNATPPVRIGLSATQRPMDQIARFLVGSDRENAAGEPDCSIVDAGHARELDLAIEVPPSELSAVCSHEQWAEIYTRLNELIAEHRSTLVFVNTRRLAERVAHHLREQLGEEAVAAITAVWPARFASRRKSVSRAVNCGRSWPRPRSRWASTSATSTWSARSVRHAPSPRFLQRVGRAGHSLGKVPKGRLFPLSRDELLESMALVRAVKRGHLDRVEIPEQPLDILAQQIVASVACEEWDEDALYQMCRRAWPYRELSRQAFDAIVTMLSEGVSPEAQARSVSASRSDSQSAARTARRTAGRDHLRRRDSRDGPVSRDRRAGGNVRRHGRRGLRRREPGRRRLPVGQHILENPVCPRGRGPRARRRRRSAEHSLLAGRSTWPHAGAVGRGLRTTCRFGGSGARVAGDADRARLAAVPIAAHRAGPASRRWPMSPRN